MLMSTPAPGRRFRTMIRRKLAITAGAVLVAGVLAGGALAAAPARASSLPDTVQLLGTEDNGTETPTLYHNIHNSNNSFQGWNAVEGNGGSKEFDLGNEVTGASIAALPDGSTQSVAIGIDGNLYHNIRYANGIWQGWVAIEGNGGSKYFFGDDPSITGMPNGSSQLIASGDDGNLYINIRNANGSWVGWSAVPGIAGAKYFSAQWASIAGMPDGSSQLIATGSGNNETYHNIRSANGIWQGWQLVEGLPGSLSQPFFGFTPSITGMPDGSSQIVEEEYGGDLYHNIRNANGIWQGWRPIGGPDGSTYYIGSAVIASLPDGSSQIFTTTVTSDATWENTRASNGSWSGWTLLNGYEEAVAAAGWGAVG
jgi:hypothetical protein